MLPRMANQESSRRSNRPLLGGTDGHRQGVFTGIIWELVYEEMRQEPVMFVDGEPLTGYVGRVDLNAAE